MPNWHTNRGPLDAGPALVRGSSSRLGDRMTDLHNRWVTASSTPGSGLEVKTSTIPGFIVVREAADERPCVFVSDRHWPTWRLRVPSGEYVPAAAPTTEEI